MGARTRASFNEADAVSQHRQTNRGDGSSRTASNDADLDFSISQARSTASPVCRRCETTLVVAETGARTPLSNSVTKRE